MRMPAALPEPGGPRPGRWARAALAVLRKEMVEILRDRRTLVAALLLPAVTMPLVVLVMPTLAHRQQEILRTRPSLVAVEGGDASGLVSLGVEEREITLVRAGDPRGALRRGEVDALVIDRGAVGEGPRVAEVFYDETRAASRAALGKLSGLAARLALRELQEAARARGSDPARLVPVVVDPRSVATPGQVGGALLASVLPFFLAVWLLLGGQYAALDVGVGERERGSLEVLLAMPAARSALAFGKFLAVLLPACAAMVVMLLAGAATLAAGGGLLTSQPLEVRLPFAATARLLVVGVALAGLLSALQLALSLRARTLREAQQGFAALYLAVALPVMLLPLLEDLLLRPWWVAVPVANAVLAFGTILTSEGAAPPAWALAGTVGTLAALTGLVLRLCSAQIGASGRTNR